ncbi:MAG: CPBP family intramembrane metalloprotease [Planctomycetes bacterium]|nr:CPBP family intramembrane metalloprotease [Planctomycetota bacterium]
MAKNPRFRNGHPPSSILAYRRHHPVTPSPRHPVNVEQISPWGLILFYPPLLAGAWVWVRGAMRLRAGRAPMPRRDVDRRAFSRPALVLVIGWIGLQAAANVVAVLEGLPAGKPVGGAPEAAAPDEEAEVDSKPVLEIGPRQVVVLTAVNLTLLAMLLLILWQASRRASLGDSAADGAEMRTCLQCGEEHDPGAVACAVCGGALSEIQRKHPPVLHGLARFGIEGRGLGQEATWGAIGFLASLPPVIAVLLATAAWRSEETQHPLIKLVGGDAALATRILVAISVVIVAPLVEELMYRVVLQTSLRRWMPPAAAIVLTAVLFSAVHGWPDLVPLLPLALVLGYVYEQRHSFAAVVVLHGLFNLWMLALALTIQS